MANPSAQALIEHFDSVFEGPNGDYPAVLESLAGVTSRQALWKPAAGCNSIWQIVEHLTSSAEWQIEMLEKGSSESPPWIEPLGGDDRWRASLERLKDAHARLTAAILQLPEDRLLSIPDGEKQALLVLLLSTAAHEAHHGGQIDYLKGLQSALSTSGS